jgi:hypothetical protein
MLADNGGSKGVWQYSGSGTKWTPVTGTNTVVSQLAANGDGLYIMAANNGGVHQVWQNVGVPNTWSALTDTNTDVAGIIADGYGLYMFANQHEWVYDGSPYQWTDLGPTIR